MLSRAGDDRRGFTPDPNDIASDALPRTPSTRSGGPNGIDPQRVMKLARRWVAVVVGIAFLGGLGAYAYSRTLPRTYRATGYVLVVQAPRSGNGGAFVLTADQVTTTYATLMTQPGVVDTVIKKLALNTTVERLSGSISATAQRDTELIEVAVSDRDPQTATSVDNALMTAFVGQVTTDNQARISKAGLALSSQIQQVQAGLADKQARLAAAQSQKADTNALQSSIQSDLALLSQLTNDYSSFQTQQAQSLDAVSLAAPAILPTHPDSPKVSLNVVLGVLGGLMLGVGVATLAQYLDQGLRNAEDVRDRLGLATLAVVANFKGSGGSFRGGKRGNDTLALGEVGEAYRRLRLNLLFSSIGTELSAVVVTSAGPGEGKTLTSVNLAASMAAAGKKVLLIDADMHRPRIHKIFGLRLEHGLSELLLQSATSAVPILDFVEHTQISGLSVLTAGTIPPNPAELLSSRYIYTLLEAFVTSFDLIIIDTPPVGAVTDACGLAAIASGSLVVVEANVTKARQAKATIEVLENVGATIVGVVLNRSRHAEQDAYYYSHRTKDSVPGNSDTRGKGEGARSVELSADGAVTSKP